MDENLIRRLLDFLDASPSCYHAVDNLVRRLEAEGYTRLRESEPWTLAAGGRYFAVRGDSTLAAFRVPAAPVGFMLAAAHSDSPTYKVREEAEVPSAGGCVRLAVEPYGGMIARSWLDRPLSVAGRLVVRREGGIATRLVNVDRDLVVIPSVAIHMNRQLNDGYKWNLTQDLTPSSAGRRMPENCRPCWRRPPAAKVSAMTSTCTSGKRPAYGAGPISLFPPRPLTICNAFTAASRASSKPPQAAPFPSSALWTARR